MSEMVERVARALSERGGLPAGISAEFWATIAIEEMLEPTDAMLRAGSVAADFCDDGWEPNATWRAMVDAALR